ncbi:MAG TPA: hypothetical protein VFE53_15480 [Mucilaginibacter sp.]|jgi:hypothetical protein|nr:hypothetical protein [Mucilaginibacter sp.]
MSFFKNIFGAKRNGQTSPFPTRTLNLKFTIAPENGANFANQYVNAVKTQDKIELDYSAVSIDFADKFLQRFRDEGLTANDFAETIFVCGCYVGEVMARNNFGKWIKQEDANLPEGVTMASIVIRLSDGTVCDPISKAFKRFHNGEVDSVAYFYQVFTTRSN